MVKYGYTIGEGFMHWIKHIWARTRISTLVVCGLLSCAPGTGPDQVSPADAEWPEYGRDKPGTKYSPLDQINPENVKNLRIA